MLEDPTKLHPLKRLARDVSGVVAIEYALIASLIAICVIAAMTLLDFEANFSGTMERIGNAIEGQQD